MVYIISKGITDSVSYKDKKVKVGDKFEERELIVLSSQMKQYLIKRLQSNIKTLKTLKAKGKKTGKIRYRKALHSIPLMQYGITYKIKDKTVQGLGDFKAIGIDQARGCYFIERNGDYFMHVVAYLPKEKVHNGRAIGIDLGIKNHILKWN
ncbi:MAG: hypothetical protein QXL00_04865 [Conexivisphaerales archaeon]